ncbi:hypothetical protein M514_00466 [Trichuris suis]|uniref:Uncharacterized protein n=1 Tax=Trichuris suis TaxID=68888 RepID=A0A085NRF6_9BILA|nr:hypothetical protein M513_00466 [Trichuris suis]KFD72052.1 hypothetical protein M514_00466 [Trichuris suis]
MPNTLSISLKSKSQAPWEIEQNTLCRLCEDSWLIEEPGQRMLRTRATSPKLLRTGGREKLNYERTSTKQFSPLRKLPKVVELTANWLP